MAGKAVKGRLTIEDNFGAIYNDDINVTADAQGKVVLKTVDLYAVPTGKEVTQNLGNYTLKVVLEDGTKSELAIAILDDTVSGEISIFGHTAATLAANGDVYIPYGKTLADVAETDIALDMDGEATATYKLVVNQVVVTVTPEIGDDVVYAMEIKTSTIGVGTDGTDGGIVVTTPVNAQKNISVSVTDDQGELVLGLTKDYFTVNNGPTSNLATELEIDKVEGLSNGTYLITLKNNLDKAAPVATPNTHIEVLVDAITSGEIAIN